MTSEQIKDIRLTCELIARDYDRLSKDISLLSEFLLPLQKEIKDCGNCQFVYLPRSESPCKECKDHNLFMRE